MSERRVRPPGRVGAAAAAVLLALAVAPAARGADLERVLPVTDEVLMLHFKEGHIDYNGVRPDGTYEPQGENRVRAGRPLDAGAASDAARYRITSPDDPAYADGRGPAAVGYKAKGTEFNSPYKEPPYLREFWVYAALPTPLRPGKTYEVHVGDLAENLDRYRFTFDVRRLRSPAIRVSGAGYPPEAPKFAYFSQWMGTLDTPEHPRGALGLGRHADGTFHLCDAATGEVRRSYRGLSLQKARSEDDPSHGNWTRADVYALDFGDFREPGRYVVVAERMGCSQPFEIGEGAYFEAHRAAMRGLFLQRRGVAKDLVEFGREYPRSHHPDLNRFVAGRVEGEGAEIRDPRPVEGIWGWYADAGDWDGYASHYVVPYTLLLTYSLRPDRFGDGDIGNRWREGHDDPWTDEGSNGLPDILDEARWLLDFGRRARAELRRQGLGDGGVPRYVGRDAGATDRPSWADDRVQYVDTGAAESTYAYAGAAAYFAHCLDAHQTGAGAGRHPESEGWIAEARDAFDWAEAREGRSEADRRQRQLAAACLHVATGEDGFGRIFREEWRSDPGRLDGAWVSPSANQLASAIYLASGKDHDGPRAAFREEVKAGLVARADRSTDNLDAVGFRFGGVEPGQGVGMNLITVPRLIFQAVAHRETGDRKYLDAMHASLAYVLGGNPEGRSRLSGVGHEREQDAFIPDAWYLLDFNHPAYRNPIFPGLSAYGLPMFDVGGPGSEGWARGSASPEIDRWPLAEQRMRNRYSIAGSEFTIHQNHPWYVLATGYLLPERDGPRPPYSRPAVRLALDADAIDPARPIRLAAETSADAARVEYYYEWHFAGESADPGAGFAVDWDASRAGLEPGAEIRITAIAYDHRGEPSLPAPAGEAHVRVASGTRPPP